MTDIHPRHPAGTTATGTPRTPGDIAPDTTDAPVGQVDLAIEGMTCAACVARVEKRLGRLDGVTAVVNLATESARITLHQERPADELVATVVKAGYGARVLAVRDLTAPAPTAEGADPGTLDTGSVPDVHDTSAPTRRRLADLRRRLLVAATRGLPVMVLSMVPAWQFTGWQWIVAALTIPIATWCAWPFHRSAATAARHGAFTMDTLVSLGVIASTGWSLWALFFGGAGQLGMRMDMSLLPALDGGLIGDAPTTGHGHTEDIPHLYFETAAMIVTFLLAGRYAEARSRHRAGDALRSLLALGAKEATRVDTDPGGTRHHRQIPTASLRLNDLFLVRPGETVATDGIVVEGHSAVDCSMLTGEPVPVDITPGDEVAGGTVNSTGALVVRATRVGEHTTLARIARMVAEAQAGKAPVQRLADRVSSVFVPVVLAISAATFLTWVMTGRPLQAAFTAAVAVLVVACPCALGLATPTALLVGSGRAAQLGIVIKGPEILESTRRIDTVLLDKTGTLTTGQMTLASVHPLDGQDEAEALAVAAAAESASEHPIAAAVVAAARDRGLSLPGATSVHASTGLGVTAEVVVDGRPSRVLVGRPAWLADQGTEISGVTELVAALPGGVTAVAVGWDGRAKAVLAVSDTVKDEAVDAIAQLRALGVEPYLLTGDRVEAALQIAAEVGIDADRVAAGVLPEGKTDEVRRLQGQGRVVAMVGDGVNDAAALTQADLGLAIGTGTDVAIEAGDVVLVSGDPRAAATAVRVSRATLRIVKQNLGWAFGYNVIALPLAAAGLLNPGIAAAFMASSSVIVVGNSLRLRRAH
ncbi:heavy metal translocating P-type ATPase [Austwickia chelonae]|uniref:heavy metal translocating P-type ATPase n=1 Tax=Austwickia chelonae TaxID=100225 RepID=UPI000E2434E0|nr:heavy metal translocating P-type ATPase [Austwickia chelonae]